MESKNNRIKLIAEIGINHNGNIDIAKKLIMYAVLTGFDYIKFQKRTPEICVPDEQKNIMRQTPWGEMTYLEYKEKIEFGKNEYDEIDRFCHQWGINWFASAWDIPSADFLSNYCDIVKIPSALITDHNLLEDCRKKFHFMIISTGMSEENEIEEAINVGNPDVVMHTNSSYPCPAEDLNLKYIDWLKNKYPKIDIGYSGHEWGLSISYSVAPKVRWIERHVTLDHNLWGTDQKSSIDPVGMVKFVRTIRDIEKASGGYGPRKLTEKEIKKRESLRK